MENKIKISYFNKYTTELHLGKLSDDDVAMILLKDHAAAISELESQLKEQCHINAIGAERELKLQRDLEAVTATIKGQHKLNDEAYAKITALTELVKLVKNKLVLCFALSDDKTIELIVRETNAKIIDELKKIGEA